MREFVSCVIFRIKMDNLKIKSFFCILIIIFSFSCASEDETQTIDPPVWILGNWAEKSFIRYRFTNNDFITIDSNGKDYSFSSYLTRGRFFLKTKSDTEYAFSFRGNIVNGTIGSHNMPNSNFQNQEDFTFYFKKINENTIVDAQGKVYERFP